MRPGAACLTLGQALVMVLILLAAPLILNAGPAQAQNSNFKALLDRVERLQRELATLQRHVYKGEPPPQTAAAAANESSADSPTRQLTAAVAIRI